MLNLNSIWILIVLKFFICTICIICFYFLIRNHQVYKLRRKISNAESKYYEEKFYKINNNLENIKDVDLSFPIYHSLESYNNMFYSFKSLKLENWLSKENYNKIKKYL